MRAHKPSQPDLRHQTWCQVDVVVIQNLQRLARKLLDACCRLDDLVCWFGRDDRTRSIGLGLEYATHQGPLVLYVVDGAPETRHPTLAGAASTGPPAPTGAATAVVAVHGLGGGLDRVCCRGLWPCKISRLCYSRTNYMLFRPYTEQKKYTSWEFPPSTFSPRGYYVWRYTCQI